MNFQPLISGSSGNCQYIETKETKILVDAGMTGKKIQELLREIQVDPKDLDGILVTHEHYDHTSAVGVLARRYGLQVFANENTWMAMEKTVKKIPSQQRQVFSTGETFHIKDLEVGTIPIFHDCVHGTSFILQDKDCKVAMLTDTGWVSTAMLEKMQGANLYYIEANHDEEMLRTGPYSFALKQRIASNRGHLSNHHAADVLSKLLEKKKEHVILAHLSTDNNDPLLATRSIRESLGKKDLHEGLHFTLEVAKRTRPSDLFTAKGKDKE